MAHISLFLLLVPLLILVNTLVNLLRNIRTAQSTGLRYVIGPYYSYNRLTALLIARYILNPLAKIRPRPSFSSWRFLVRTGKPWRHPYAPFALLNTSTFLLVAPGGIILYTADADVISQITSRDKDFPKASWLYKPVSIYGANVVSSDGAAWRHHRKLTAPAFTEKNHQLVWSETLEQSQAMLASWSGDRQVDTVANDCMRLSLNVINYAGFGRKTPWHASNDMTATLPPGHTMTFTHSLKSLLDNIVTIMILPLWVLKYYPNSRLNKSYRAYAEWGQYMREMIQTEKPSKADVPTTTTKVDIISQLVKSQSTDPAANPDMLTESEVLGNLFVLLLAGHETTANSIHFALLFLALHPHIQRAVQRDLDQIFHSRPITSWNYDTDIPLLQNSLLAAVLNEQLRLIPAALSIPKITHTAQHLTVDGRDVTLPAGMMIRLCVQSVHHNPKYWPSHERAPREANDVYPDWKQEDDLNTFRPARWITTEGMLVPPKGAYIPFSEGQRACLGKRFAQVEILAALAVILRGHSVELGVEEFLEEGKEVEELDAEEKRTLWKKAEKDAWRKLREKLVSIITVQMAGKGVGVSVVKRGEERVGSL